jgi:hypothetical protein
MIGDEAPAEARLHALSILEVARRLVRRDHHLPVLVDQRIEGVEELLLGRILAADELHVVDHQHVDRAELLLERDGVLEAQCLHELVHELLGGEVDHPPRRRVPPDLPCDGMHQMRLAEADAAIEEQRVERRAAAGRRRFRDAAGRGVGELVRLADDKILEGEARVERRRDLAVAEIAIAVEFRAHRLRRVGLGC